MPDGYVCVRVDSRGAGRSPGYVDHFSPHETADFAAFIEWAAYQPWSSGSGADRGANAMTGANHADHDRLLARVVGPAGPELTCE